MLKNILQTLYLVMLASIANAQSFAEQNAVHIKTYKAAFLTDQNSPLKANDLDKLRFYAPDSTFRVTANVTLLEGQQPFKMPTYDGTSKEFIRFARLTFPLKGKQVTMTIYKSPGLATNPIYKDYLFLPFTDETNGKETYGGGRYIDLSAKDIKDDKIEIDFNKAYNPYCAYSSGYRCPVPPQENDLPLAVKAGEQLFTGQHKTKPTQ